MASFKNLSVACGLCSLIISLSPCSYTQTQYAYSQSNKGKGRPQPQSDTAQQSGTAAQVKIQFTHTPPKAEQLPPPGMPLTLSVWVNKEVLGSGLKVRAVITRDGKLFEQQDNDARIDQSDRLLYSIEIPSPLAEVSYQFIFADKSGSTVGTKRYTVRRTCIPNVVGEVKGSGEDPKVLKEQSEKLESDISLLDEITKNIQQIQETIDNK